MQNDPFLHSVADSYKLLSNFAGMARSTNIPCR
jgi:hypothetical protein